MQASWRGRPIGVEDEDGAIHDVHLLGCMAGRQRCVACDHHQLMARVLQRTPASSPATPLIQHLQQALCDRSWLADC